MAFDFKKEYKEFYLPTLNNYCLGNRFFEQIA